MFTLNKWWQWEIPRFMEVQMGRSQWQSSIKRPLSIAMFDFRRVLYVLLGKRKQVTSVVFKGKTNGFGYPNFETHTCPKLVDVSWLLWKRMVSLLQATRLWFPWQFWRTQMISDAPNVYCGSTGQLTLHWQPFLGWCLTNMKNWRCATCRIVAYDFNIRWDGQ